MARSLLRLLRRRLWRGTALAFAVLLALNLAAVCLYAFAPEIPRWTLDLFLFKKEQNLPTLFSTLLLLGGAVACGLVARHTREGRLGWAGLGGVFAFLAVDEFARIHERVGVYAELALDLHFAWIVPYAVFALVVGLLYARWTWRLPRETRAGVVVAGAVYVGGALGMEAVAELYVATFGREVGLRYDLLTTVEESMEMIGAALFGLTVLGHLDAHTRFPEALSRWAQRQRREGQAETGPESVPPPRVVAAAPSASQAPTGPPLPTRPKRRPVAS